MVLEVLAKQLMVSITVCVLRVLSVHVLILPVCSKELVWLVKQVMRE